MHPCIHFFSNFSDCTIVFLHKFYRILYMSKVKKIFTLDATSADSVCPCFFSESVESLGRVNRLFTTWMGCYCVYSSIVGYVKVVCSIILAYPCFHVCPSVLQATVSQLARRISNELLSPVISSLDYSNCTQSNWGEEQAGLRICREPWEMCVCQWKDRWSVACMHACIVLISFVMRASNCLKENSGLSSRDLETVLFIALNRD